jgi:hypothetical protein
VVDDSFCIRHSVDHVILRALDYNNIFAEYYLPLNGLKQFGSIWNNQYNMTCTAFVAESSSVSG